jgi:hypothetical protein
MTATILAMLAELALGAGVVCAEAHTLGPDERAAVAASVLHRTAQTGETGVQAMTAPRSYARPCPARLVDWTHAAAYLRGRLGMGPAWSRGVIAFHARHLDDARWQAWSARGWTVAHRGRGHTYYRGRMKR